MLAQRLNLNLICNGTSGQHWWATRNFLKTINQEQWNATQVIVFVHTFVNRIPNLDPKLAQVNFSKLNPDKEIDSAVGLYYKYIHNDEFLTWAQQAWFAEINQQWTRPVTIHLHGFDQSLNFCDQLTGKHMVPDLTSLSLLEAGTKDIWILQADYNRVNHFTEDNNQILAEQIYNIVEQADGKYQFDLTKFNFKGAI